MHILKAADLHPVGPRCASNRFDSFVLEIFAHYSSRSVIILFMSLRKPRPLMSPIAVLASFLFIIIIIIIYLSIAIGLLPGGSGYFTCKQNMKLVTTRFKSGGLHKKHVVATWNLGNHLSICL